MKELGQMLREAREKKGMSLTEIQEATKIRLRYLEAIESGNLDVIPGEVYRKGFIVNYANAVGLDSETIIRKYQQLKTAGENPGGVKPHYEPLGQTENKTVKPQTPAIPKEDPSAVKSPAQPARKSTVKPTVRLTFKPGPALFWFGGVLLVILLVLVFSKTQMRTNIATTSQNSKKSALITGKTKPENNPEQTKKTGNTGKPTTTQQIFPAPITVYAEFSAEVWIQLKADNQVLYPDNGVTFNSKSPRQIWTAQKEMVIRMGNPAGVKLILNGKDLGPLGEPGMPKTVTLSVNGIKAP
jgi:cytoskeletal protein RodZ